MKASSVRRISGKNAHFLAAGVVMSLFMNVAVVSGTGVIADLIDTFIQSGQVEFGTIGVRLFVCMAAGTVCAFLKKYFAGLYSIAAAKQLNEFAIDKLPRIQYSFFEREGSGKIITKLISDMGELEKYYEATLPELINSVISIILVLVYVGRKNVWLMLASLCLYPIVLVFTYFLGKRLKVLADKRRGKIDVMVGRVTDSIEGIEIIRSYNLYHKFAKHIGNAVEDILENEYVRAWITHFSQTVNRILFWIPNMVCPAVAMLMVINENMTIGAMTAYIVLINKIMGAIKGMPFLFNERRERKVSMERVEKVFNEAEDYFGEAEKSVETLKVSAVGSKRAVVFDKVNFAYKNGAAMVLKDFSFEIPEGKTVAFVGESGQGKSTVFKLLCGLYENESGHILVDGVDSKTGMTFIRNKIAVVEQKPFLFEGTIYDNIAVGAADLHKMSKPLVERAARLAGIHEFISALPKGYETMLGENGAGLSGGEKQRIAIARALAKNAPILLMDEPTSSVDVDTEKIIRETVEKLKGTKTVMVIAHRLSTIQNSDIIMVVSGGRICESGTHMELMEANGIYRGLYEREELNCNGN